MKKRYKVLLRAYTAENEKEIYLSSKNFSHEKKRLTYVNKRKITKKNNNCLNLMGQDRKGESTWRGPKIFQPGSFHVVSHGSLEKILQGRIL